MPFIVLDGPDATGTSTHCRFLAERLTAQGKEVLLTAEPTDGPMGVQIRQILNEKEKLEPMALQMLFCADRAWHVEHVIAPALKAGKTIVCDRYWHSTIVYAAAQDLPTSELLKLNMTFPQPDVTIFTLPPIEVALKRMQKRSASDLFEKETFQRRLHEEYKKLAAQHPSITIVDTSGEKTAVADIIERLAKT